MDTYAFIDAILGRISWPIATLAIALLYKRPIIKAIGALTRLKIGDTEMEFSNAVLEADRLTAVKDSSVIIPDDVRKLLGLNPRMAVIEAFIKLEMAIMTKAVLLNIETGDKRRVKLVFWDMHNQGYVDITDMDLFNRLYQIRNGVAHGGLFSGQIEETDAAICVNLMFTLIGKINHIQPK